ncbi:ABC transporter permease [Ancylobacter oerskovii]|uniref:ABC transporter permease n=1 Tax=Ancylobacter oerskovii TaxID=459519 RepID=A0ABW4YUW4_9HYPH|nr:ABC transporter permease [Ancylobacter oerskovii]MBS7544611.1 ABC transporter permease [Ancylobacter oerskovii]
MYRLSVTLGQFLVFVVFFAIWELLVDLLHIRPVILPAPTAIAEKIWENRALLLKESWPTFAAISLGFIAAVVSGFLLAVGIAYSRIVRDLTYPFLIAAQILPKIAFAPLFLIWFGFGLTPKIVIAALIAFFPIVINTAKGLTSVDKELLQYMDSLGSSGWEKFTKISLPWALPYIFAALKISITLAIVGAVVGEFVAAGEGLGYVINSSNITLNTELMFAAIVTMSVLGILMYLAIVLLERYMLPQGQLEDSGHSTM